MHEFLIHHKGDQVGVATTDIEAVFMKNDSTIEVRFRHTVPLGHKIAIEKLAVDAPVMKYGIQIGYTTTGFEIGDYVHTHKLKTARW